MVGVHGRDLERHFRQRTHAIASQPLVVEVLVEYRDLGAEHRGETDAEGDHVGAEVEQRGIRAVFIESDDREHVALVRRQAGELHLSRLGAGRVPVRPRTQRMMLVKPAQGVGVRDREVLGELGRPAEQDVLVLDRLAREHPVGILSGPADPRGRGDERRDLARDGIQDLDLGRHRVRPEGTRTVGTRGSLVVDRLDHEDVEVATDVPSGLLPERLGGLEEQTLLVLLGAGPHRVLTRRNFLRVDRIQEMVDAAVGVEAHPVHGVRVVVTTRGVDRGGGEADFRELILDRRQVELLGAAEGEDQHGQPEGRPQQMLLGVEFHRGMLLPVIGVGPGRGP